MARKVLICDNPNFSGSPSNGVKDCYARLTDTGAEAERRAPGGAEPPGEANAPGPIGEEAKAARGPGAVGAGGSEAEAQGAGVREEPDSMTAPSSPKPSGTGSFIRRGCTKAGKQKRPPTEPALMGFSRILVGYPTFCFRRATFKVAGNSTHHTVRVSNF
jgi:hypothetical protein